jgi:spore cortex formation protein SpoVR/YcgB (stage V sporulation)
MQATDAATSRRNEAIRAAVASGETMQSVADRYGITRQRVDQIVGADPALRAYLRDRRERAKQAGHEAREARREAEKAKLEAQRKTLQAALAPPPPQYDRVCAVAGCERPHYSRALCRAHYNQAREYGLTKDAA